MELNYASKGVAGSGLGLGIAGTALGVLNALNNGNNGGGLLNILGGNNGNYVSRNELAMAQELASKDAKIGLLEADKYTDSKFLDFLGYVNGEIKELRTEMRGNKDAQDKINLDQAVYNGTNNAAMGCMNERIAELRAIIGGVTKVVIPESVICTATGTATT